jgi:Domain of unknown function DUF29
MSAPGPQPTQAGDPLYQRDFFAWTLAQAEALRRAAREAANLPLDYDNLATEIESAGKRDRRDVEMLLQRLVEHLLKYAASPTDEPHKKWRKEIREFRRELGRLLRDSPSLRAQIAQMLPDAARYAWQDVEENLRDHGEYDRALAVLMKFRQAPLSPSEVSRGLPVPGTRDFVEEKL